jgi:hypothetical protein
MGEDGNNAQPRGRVEHDLARLGRKFVTFDVQEAGYYRMYDQLPTLRFEFGRAYWEFDFTDEIKRLHRQYKDSELIKLKYHINALQNERRQRIRGQTPTQEQTPECLTESSTPNEFVS